MEFNLKLEDIRYVNIKYRNSEGLASAVKAGVKKIGTREILAAGKFEEDIFIKYPQEVVVDFICFDGLHQGVTNLVSVAKEEPYVFFIFYKPEEMEHQQNREYFRVLASFECIYKMDNTEFKTKTFDISAGGVSIVLEGDNNFESISEITLAINNKVLVIPVRYVRSTKAEEEHIGSFQFTNITSMNRDFIAQVCLQIQLEERRKLIK